MNIGRVVGSVEQLLRWLDFEGGVVVDVGIYQDYANTFYVTIAHPDMPEVGEGSCIPRVDVSYTTETFCYDLKPVRSYPPKKEGNDD